MTKQEIVDKLATRENFHKIVEVCLHDDLEITQTSCFPEINIYMNSTEYNQKETGEFKDESSWLTVMVDRDSFEVNGEMMTGVKNFFKHYKEITKFIRVEENFEKHLPDSITTIWKVSPHDWYRSTDSADGHFEISYDCHSLHEHAMIIIVNDVVINERYYVEGERLHREDFLKESREFKLSRILGIDLRTERLAEEKKQKEIARLIHEKEQEQEENAKWTTKWTRYHSDNSCYYA